MTYNRILEIVYASLRMAHVHYIDDCDDKLDRRPRLQSCKSLDATVTSILPISWRVRSDREVKRIAHAHRDIQGLSVSLLTDSVPSDLGPVARGMVSVNQRLIP